MINQRGNLSIVLNVLGLLWIAALEGIKNMNKPGTIRTVAGTKGARQLAAKNQKPQAFNRMRFEETPQQREIREWNEAVERKKDSK